MAMRYAQCSAFLYCFLASSDCMRVLMTLRGQSVATCVEQLKVEFRAVLSCTHSNGMVVYTVMTPAMDPIPKVIQPGNSVPGAMLPCAICLMVE